MTVRRPDQQSLELVRAPDDQQWVEYVRGVLARDDRVQVLIGSEHLDAEDVLNEALKLAKSPQTPDLQLLYQELVARLVDRDTAIRKRDGAWLGFGIAPLGLVFVKLVLTVFLCAGLVALVFLGTPIWAQALVGILGAVALAFLTPGLERRWPSEEGSAVLAVERLDAELAEQVTSLLLVPAIERLASINFRTPGEDPVRLAETRYLGARIIPGSRVQTSSYRRVLTSLRRAGGATIGLAGSRGVGKSELLRAFCDNPYERASLDNAGTIGVVVAAPVAYVPADFLRLLIKRIAEQVPSYRSDPARRSWQPTSTDLIALGSLVACLATALTLLGAMAEHRHGVGWLLMAAALLIAIGWLKLRFINEYRLARRSKPSFRRPNDLNAASARITRQVRLQLAQRAAEVAQRMRYLESRTSNLEASAGVGKLGVKSTGGLSLAQLAQTDADLVAEFQTFVSELHAGGYNLIIGIDELDKQVDGERATEFLNGIKVLFDVRDCSFLLTVSDNAFAQFAQRGMPIRDVFDSSLDEVIWVEHLSFLEARRMVRARRTSSHGDDISDTQLLLCHTLAGGLPRDLLRYARQLAELSSRADQSLHPLVPELLTEDLRNRVSGVTAAVIGRTDGVRSTALISELEELESAWAATIAAKTCADFLLRDTAFAQLCDGQDPHEAVDDWIDQIRRQLYSYLYFANTVRESFLTDTFSGEAESVVRRFEKLAEARRRLEIDAAAGWRAIRAYRIEYELDDQPDSGATASRTGDGEVLAPSS